MAMNPGNWMQEPSAAADAGEDAMSDIDVFALWQLSPSRAIESFAANAPRIAEDAAPRLGVAVVEAGHVLEYTDLVELERAGLLVIEVPSALKGHDLQELRGYVGSQLAGVRPASAGAAGSAAASGDPDAHAYGPLHSPFDAQGERHYLDILNDPRAADELW